MVGSVLAAMYDQLNFTDTTMTAPTILTRGYDALDFVTSRFRPKVDIRLTGQDESPVRSYTTSDRIDGSVVVTVDNRTPFDRVEISFEGTTKISLERASALGRTGATHPFLKMRQPMTAYDYPSPRVLESGRVYTFPFTFVVPDRLVPHACSHPKNNVQIGYAHSMLPPTLGDPMLSGNGMSLLDDFTPELCSISYCIRVSILRNPPAGKKSCGTLASAAKRVRIIPVVDEEPPLNISKSVPAYYTRKEKDVRRGFMRGKFGRLTMAAPQPGPIQLLCPNPKGATAESTALTVNLRFDPVRDERPPPLGSLRSKLKAATYFSTYPWEDYPFSLEELTAFDTNRGLYKETVTLSNFCVSSTQWMEHCMPARDCLQPKTYYTASILMPITLPKKKAFVPTFYSCLISRVYSLELNVSYETPNANLLNPSITLKLPIQITCQPETGRETGPLSYEAVIQEDAAEEYIRSLGV
ncbi:hypothetical protein MAP00_001198 [Monascus purpureus]|nr:hypothetical protein MAP00_001198 [Monascus purpureus]